ncbi:MAG: hypothetical protein IT356_12735 [Gemmatimonadaceae bacterium]|nr:hypothetical protein [Gemmatimonadaceae bacterium]
MNEIDKYQTQELAWNNKPVRSTDEQIVTILGPMFALFPQTKADKNTVAVYVMMLRDLDPQTLAAAVLKAMNTCKFLPTVAEIREQLESRAPGPRSDVDPRQLKPVPSQMFRLDEEEDRRQRMERLRQTKDWGRYYL